MDKPLCRLCGHKHWGDEHVWPEEPKKKLGSLHQEGGKADIGSVEVYEDKPKFDRVAYQREYMRKRRAKRGE